MLQREMINMPDWIRVVDAEVPLGTEYWRLTKVEYWDDKKSGGTHHIYTQTPHDPSARLVVSNGQQSWQVALDKPDNEPSSNFAMWGGNQYSAYMEGLPSERIEGMHMPAKHHVSYLLSWERAVKSGTSGTSGGTGSGGTSGGTGSGGSSQGGTGSGGTSEGDTGSGGTSGGAGSTSGGAGSGGASGGTGSGGAGGGTGSGGGTASAATERQMVNVPDWIRVVDADVGSGSQYWQLERVEYWDDKKSGGTHHIYTQTPHDPSARLVVSNGQQSWQVALDKPHNEPSSNFAMWGGNQYSAYMEGLPSDRIEGMHMPAKHHVSYLLWWKRAVKSGASGTSGGASSGGSSEGGAGSGGTSGGTGSGGTSGGAGSGGTSEGGAGSGGTGSGGTSGGSGTSGGGGASGTSPVRREMINVPDWIRVVDANLPPGTRCWRLTKVEYWDDQKSGGTHHIYTMSPHDGSKRIVVSNGQQSWPIPLDKPHNEASSNFAMWGGNQYSAHMEGLPSDRIEGMHMPAKHHVSYLLWWEER